MKKKIVLMATSLVLVVAMAVGGTLAWLTDTTTAVENTFTMGKVDIDLNETTGPDYKVSPGATIEKDPAVTVKVGSEASWLFVKIEESAGFDDYITYQVAEGWTQLDGYKNVYYRNGPATIEEGATDLTFPVLANDQVVVKDDVTGFTGDVKLTFTAYAIQKDNVADAVTAWGYLNS